MVEGGDLDPARVRSASPCRPGSASACTEVARTRSPDSRNAVRVVNAGHQFLVNKFYLDDLYGTIVHAVGYPIAKASLLGQPERHRWCRRRCRPTDTQDGCLGLPQRRPASGRRSSRRNRHRRERERRRPPTRPVRQGQPIRRAVVRSCDGRRHRPDPHQRLSHVRIRRSVLFLPAMSQTSYRPSLGAFGAAPQRPTKP